MESIDIRQNNQIREEILNLLEEEITKNKDEDFVRFITHERNRIIHQHKVDTKFYGERAPKMEKYIKDMSLQLRVNLMKRFMSMLAYHYNTNTSISEKTLLWIDNKIQILYRKVGKGINLINERKEYIREKYSEKSTD